MHVLSDKKSELDSCTFAKMVLMLLVVAGHCTEMWTGSWYGIEPVIQNRLFGVFTDWINSIHTYCFVLISGYIFYFIKYERGGYDHYGKFIKNKFKRLIVPYIFVGAVWVMPVASILFHYSAIDIVKNFVFAVKPGQLWFLLALFLIFALFYPLSDFCKNKTALSFVLMLLLYAVSIILDKTFVYFQLNRVLRYMILFWIGFVLREYEHGFLYKIPAVLYFLADIAVFVASKFLVPSNAFAAQIAGYAYSFLLRILGPLMAFVLLQKATLALKAVKNSGPIKFFEKNSMVIYIFHMQIVLILNATLNGKVPTPVHVLISYVSSVAAALVIGTILKRWTLTKKLIGEA